MDIKIKITTTDGGGEVKIFAADTNAFTYAISELKGIIPAAFRNYEPTKKTWLISDWECLDEWIGELRSVYVVETVYGVLGTKQLNLTLKYLMQ